MAEVVAAAQVAAMVAVVTLAAAIAVVMTVATPVAVVALVAVSVVAIQVVASARLIAHHARMRQHLLLTQRRARLIVRLLSVHVMAKIAPLLTSIATQRRVVISLIVGSVVLRRVTIARLLVTVLTVRHSMIVRIVAAIVRLVSAQASVIRDQRGAAMIAARRVAITLMQHLRNVANSRRASSVLSELTAPTVRAMTICRFNAQRG